MPNASVESELGILRGLHGYIEGLAMTLVKSRGSNPAIWVIEFHLIDMLLKPTPLLEAGPTRSAKNKPNCCLRKSAVGVW